MSAHGFCRYNCGLTDCPAPVAPSLVPKMRAAISTDDGLTRAKYTIDRFAQANLYVTTYTVSLRVVMPPPEEE